MNISALTGGIAAIAWAAAVGIFVMLTVRAARNRPVQKGGLMILIAIIIAAVFSTASSGMVFISPEERGVVISAASPTGYRSEALMPGLHWIIPFAENVVRYPISRQTYTMSIATSEGQVQGDDSITARTADGQELFLDASVIYAINPEKVVQVHIQWQDRYPTDLVRAQARGIMRDSVSQFRVEEVVTSKRLELVKIMRETMAEKLDENGLMLVDFVMRNITFSKEYAASVEQKQIAEQQAQQAKFVVESKRQEAEQARQTAQGQADAVVINAKGSAESRLIQAEAEAKSLQLIAEVIKNNPSLLTYQYINKLSPNIQTMLLPSNAPFIFPIPNMGDTYSNSQSGGTNNNNPVVP
jgi:regulator of protease activity HflC (stomatin/prohibitin superfamily)